MKPQPQLVVDQDDEYMQNLSDNGYQDDNDVTSMTTCGKKSLGHATETTENLIKTNIPFASRPMGKMKPNDSSNKDTHYGGRPKAVMDPVVCDDDTVTATDRNFIMPAEEPKKRRVSFGASSQPLKELPINTAKKSKDIGPLGGCFWEDPNRRLSVGDKSYILLDVLGKGGSCVVSRVISTDQGIIYAFKKVQIKGSDEEAEATLQSYSNEIDLLKKLKGKSKYIISLEDYSINREDMCISMILEAGETDLAKLLQSVSVDGDLNKYVYNPLFVRLRWREMLEAVEFIHSHKIIHGVIRAYNI